MDGTNILKVPGLRVDKVAKVIRHPGSDLFRATKNDWNPQNNVAFLTWELECLELSRAVYGVSEGVPEAHWRTLVANIQDYENPAPKEFEQAYKFLMDVFLHRADEFIDDVLGPIRLSGSSSAIWDLFTQRLQVIYGQRFFSTRDGRIQLGPKDITPGDDVYVFYSGGLHSFSGMKRVKKWRSLLEKVTSMVL